MRQHDLTLCSADGTQISGLDRMPVTKVVAQQQRRPPTLRRRRHMTQLNAQAGDALLQRRPAHAGPEMAHRFLHHMRQRALDAHRIVQTRSRKIRPRRNVIEDVDAADIGDPAVDHRQLAVHTAQTITAQQKETALAAEPLHFHAGAAQRFHPFLGQLCRAETIEQQAHRDLSLGCALQRLRNKASGIVCGEDVSLHMHRMLRGIDVGTQTGKVFAAVLQQGQLMRTDLETAVHCLFSCASRAAWSDMRRVSCTWHPTTSKPRA